MASLYTVVYPTPAEIRDNILRTLKNGLMDLGISNPAVGPGTDYYVLAQGVANEIAVAVANAQILDDQRMPDTAVGTDLDRVASIWGLSRRPAGGSSGFIILDSTASTTIATGAQLTDGAGLRYEVTAGGTYADADVIPVSAVDTGFATNLEAGETLQWVSAPAYANTKALVASGGLTNGVDAETDETLRARLLSRLQNAPSTGNWEHVAQFAEESWPTVQKAFVYPALQGPGTVSVAVTAAPTATNKSRALSSTTVTNKVKPYIEGNMPEHVLVNVTPTTDVNTDVSFVLTLPDAPTASPPGPGGGWLDGTPWPSLDTSDPTPPPITVTAVTSTTVLTVDAVTSPIEDVSRIAWLSPTNWELYTATVTAVSGTSGAYVITLDKPFTGITTGCYIWPQCENQQTYVDAVLEAFALMGPGEKTSNTSDLVRGYRHPTPSSGWPYSLGGKMLRSLVQSGDEVLDADYLTRSTTTPSVAASATSNPNILIPRHIAFYKAV